MTYGNVLNVQKCRNILKNALFLAVTMAIPKMWSYIEGQLCETLSVEQFSTDFDICYDILSTIIELGGKLFLRLNETFRMIGHSILSNNVNFVEIGFGWL